MIMACSARRCLPLSVRSPPTASRPCTLCGTSLNSVGLGGWTVFSNFAAFPTRHLVRVFVCKVRSVRCEMMATRYEFPADTQTVRQVESGLEEPKPKGLQYRILFESGTIHNRLAWGGGGTAYSTQHTTCYSTSTVGFGTTGPVSLHRARRTVSTLCCRAVTAAETHKTGATLIY
jgi:hypothetical protein